MALAISIKIVILVKVAMARGVRQRLEAVVAQVTLIPPLHHDHDNHSDHHALR